MKEESFELAVIGSGPAGEKAAIEGARLGAKVVVIEKGFKPGGASVISGTLPSKSIRETVQYINSLSCADISGVAPRLDGKISVKEIMHRKDRVIIEKTQKIQKGYDELGVAYRHGEASFLSPNRILVHDEDRDLVIHAEKIIIAVGTRPYRPADITFTAPYICDSDTILAMTEIPDSIAIYGGGVIGCEYASIFSKLGSQVYLVDPRGTLLDFVDRDLSVALAKTMSKTGITLQLGDRYESVSVNQGQVTLRLASGKEIHSSLLLYANGRQGVADKLNLQACDIPLNQRNQIDVNAQYQTTQENIYAVGDIIGQPSLVSTANEEGRLAANFALGRNMDYQIEHQIPCGIYTIPEIAMIGPTEQELQAKGVDYVAGVCNIEDLARGMILGEKGGLLKLLFERESRRLIGAHIMGPSAAELIHIGQAVIALKGTVDFFVEHVFNFPTLASAYKVAARSCHNQLKRTL